MRVSARDDDLLVEAAGLAGVTVSEFVLMSALSDAEEIVAAHHTVVLDDEPYARLFAALDRPPRPIAALADQIRRSRHLQRID